MSDAGPPALTKDQITAARDLRQAGNLTLGQIAHVLGVRRDAVIRSLSEHPAATVIKGLHEEDAEDSSEGLQRLERESGTSLRDGRADR